VILPLVLTVMFGAIEAGRMVVTRAMLSYATIEASRTAAVSGSTTLTQVRDMVKNAAPMLVLNNSNIVVSAGPSVPLGGVAYASDAAFAARVTGSQVTVAVTYTFSPAISIPAAITSRTWTDTNTVTVGSP
jgi:Flp pilus assembly protein TadG